MKNILVTGGAGFIGSNFIRRLQASEADVRIINLDALTYAGSLENLRQLPYPDRHFFIKGDITDQALVLRILREHSIDTIVHFAAESHVDRSILGPAPFIQTNINGTFSLLEAARSVWLDKGSSMSSTPRFHHISTDEVFGTLGPGDPPFSEKTSYAPNSPYAASKASSDHLVRAYAHTFQLPVTISNCSNNYGPYQFPEKLIPLVILNAISGKTLPIYGDGGQIRDWLFVEDHCDAILSILTEGKPGETYNIGGGNQPTNLEIVHQICQILDERLPTSTFRPHESLIEFVPDRPGHDRRYAMDITKIKTELGWSPRESLATGLKKTIEWYLDHNTWLEEIPKKPSLKEWLDLQYSKRNTTP
jgi:dTDP-glucose 4,6-dehydratase